MRRKDAVVRTSENRFVNFINFRDRDKEKKTNKPKKLTAMSYRPVQIANWRPGCHLSFFKKKKEKKGNDRKKRKIDR